MQKQKSLSQLESERAACERQLVQLQHKVQQYETVLPTARKANGESARTDLSPVEPPWKAWLPR